MLLGVYLMATKDLLLLYNMKWINYVETFSRKGRNALDFFTIHYINYQSGAIL